MIPPCRVCGKPATKHRVMREKLACAWEGNSLKREGDWGEATPLVVQAMYLLTGKKVSYNLAYQVKKCEREGITIG